MFPHFDSPMLRVFFCACHLFVMVFLWYCPSAGDYSLFASLYMYFTRDVRRLLDAMATQSADSDLASALLRS